MTTINLERSPFLSAALEFIKDHPGACKREIIYGVGGNRNRYTGRLANRTYSYRNGALSQLLHAGLCENRGHGGRYAFYAKED